MRFVNEPMQFEDIEAVVIIENECFSTPWPSSAYKRELKDPSVNRYLVCREVPDDYVPWTRRDQTLLEAERTKHPGQQILSSIFPFFFNAAEQRTLHKVIGYAGLTLHVDEAHVTTIGIKPSYRGRGLGELLLMGLVDESIAMKAVNLTLEVRASNESAQNLYRKYGFVRKGVRRRYYSDDNEDALIMTSDLIASPNFQLRLAQLRDALQQRVGLIHLTHEVHQEVI